MLGAGWQQGYSRSADGQGVYLCVHGRVSRNRRKLFDRCTTNQYGGDEHFFNSAEQSLQQVPDHTVSGFSRLAHQRDAGSAAEHRAVVTAAVLAGA